MSLADCIANLRTADTDRAVEEAIRCHLTIDDDYGTRRFIRIVRAPSRGKLRRDVREMNLGSIPNYSPYDCTGLPCHQSAVLIKSYKGDGEWVGIAEMSVSLDV